MAGRRPSSSSQSNRWCGDYTWDVPSASTVNGCERRLSELSLMSPSALSDAESPDNSRSYWRMLGSPAVPSPHQSGFANPIWGSVDSNNHSSNSPAYWASDEPEPISTRNYQRFEPSALSGSANDGTTENETGFTDSMHVSPRSSPPSKGSTIDDSSSYGTQRCAEPGRSERKYSGSEASTHNKKKKWNSKTYQQMTPRSSRKSHQSVLMSTGNRDKSTRYSPYPLAIADDDLYDQPASVPSVAHVQGEQYSYATSLNDEEDWDFCDPVASPYSTIEYPDMHETST